MIQYGVRLIMVREENPGYDTTKPVCCARDVAEAVRDMFEGLDREMVVVLALDAKNRINARAVVSIGHLTGSLVHSREFFKVAIKANAYRVVMVHNHPSGDVTPSADDVALVKRLVQAGEILGIEFLDSVIVSDTLAECLSMREAGYMLAD